MMYLDDLLPSCYQCYQIVKSTVRRVLVIFTCLLSLVSSGQSLSDKLLLHSGMKESDILLTRSRIEDLTSAHLKDNPSDLKHLRSTYHAVREEFLRKYEVHASLEEMFTSGLYDCLTATAIYSAVLEELHYSFDIIETNYHVFLMIETSRGMVLLETTDPVNGLVTSKKEIAARLESYRLQEPANVASGKLLNKYSFELFRKVSDDGLIGLLYFNQAARAFNHGDLVSSARSLQKSESLHESPRCTALGELLLKSIADSKVDDKKRAECMELLKGIWMSDHSITVLQD